MFYISYLTRGSANFIGMKMTTRYPVPNDPKLLAELKEIRQMGYLAMICHNSVEGFQSWTDFEDDKKRMEYYIFCKMTYK
jgi:hypothetical protein